MPSVPRRIVPVFLSLVVALAVMAAPAAAEVRSGGADDAKEMPVGEPDLMRVRVTYDSTIGRLEVRFQLYAIDRQESAKDLMLRLGRTCQQPDASTSNTFGDMYYGGLEVGGALVLARTEYDSQFRGEYIYTYQAEALKNRDWRCASGIGYAAQYSDGTTRGDAVRDFTLTSPSAPASSQTGRPRPGAPGAAGKPSAAGQPGAVGPPGTATGDQQGVPSTARRLSASVRLRGRYMRARVYCRRSGPGVVRVSWRRSSVSRRFRCVASRTVIARAPVPRSVQRVHVRVSVGGDRIRRLAVRRPPT